MKLQMKMQALGRKTEAPQKTNMGNQEAELNAAPPVMRNSMQNMNHMQMKSLEQLMPKFSNEQGLFYRDIFVYPNNSIYRGQMKKKDESTKKMLAE